MTKSPFTIDFEFTSVENKDRFTLLFDLIKAVEEFNYSEVQARLNIDPEQISRKDCYENSLLHIASKVGNHKAVELLLNYDIDLFAVNLESKTPFHLAIENKHDQCLKLLVEFTKTTGYFSAVQWNSFINEISIEAATFNNTTLT